MTSTIRLFLHILLVLLCLGSHYEIYTYFPQLSVLYDWPFRVFETALDEAQLRGSVWVVTSSDERFLSIQGTAAVYLPFYLLGLFFLIEPKVKRND